MQDIGTPYDFIGEQTIMALCKDSKTQALWASCCSSIARTAPKRKIRHHYQKKGHKVHSLSSSAGGFEIKDIVMEEGEAVGEDDSLL